nr:unnamed protein product [Callosobruchus analis]
MEWHVEATIREGSVMLSIPETDDDNFIAVKTRKTSRAPTSSAPTPIKTTNTFGVLTIPGMAKKTVKVQLLVVVI